MSFRQKCSIQTVLKSSFVKEKRERDALGVFLSKWFNKNRKFENLNEKLIYTLEIFLILRHFILVFEEPLKDQGLELFFASEFPQDFFEISGI